MNLSLKPAAAALLLSAATVGHAFAPVGYSRAALPSASFVPRNVHCNLPLLPTQHPRDRRSIGSLRLSLDDIVESATASKDAVVAQTATVLHAVNTQLSNLFQSQLRSALRTVQTLLQGADTLRTNLLQTAQSLSTQTEQLLLQKNPQLHQIYLQLTHAVSDTLAGSLHVDPAIVLLLSTFVSFSVVSSALNAASANDVPSQPYPDKRYNPTTARLYFDQRPGQVVTRAVEIAVQSLGFGISLLQDKVNDTWERNQEQRALELAELLTRLGPTFIKIGQSLSIRTDLLTPAYVRGLASLQDQVKAFDTNVARGILEEEWGGRSVDSVLKNISAKPVAAASLGQVYKATMTDGREVAIKVQRPDIMNQIALDMHLLREFAPFAKRTFNLNTDTVGTVDAWGLGFVDELDYLQEAQNAEIFMSKIQYTPLKDVVSSPDVVKELSTDKVLVTEWVDGERLDKSSSEDITVLCSVAMNTYLTMMLEIGLLHCDPHPGNLLRTTDGKLCILDWGMVTRLGPDLQLTLIEHMAHLTSADYGEIPRDLLLLGFIPQNKANLIADSGVVEVLADIYSAWTSGGGVAAVNVNKVIADLQDLTAEKGNLFQIPPYFAYIAKSFSVLEGIGLSNDPKYSIINECLPYVSQRLLTDKMQMGPALSTFVFGPEKSDLDTRIVDIDRIEQLVTGLGNYTTSTSGALRGQQNVSTVRTLEKTADYLLDIVFTEEESPVQDIILEQLAKIVTATSRSIWLEFRQSSGVLPTGRSVLGTIVDPLGLFRTSSLVEMSDLDHRTVETTRRLISLLQKQAEANGQAVDLSSLTANEIMELSSILTRKVWDRRGGLLRTGSRFATKVLELTVSKLESGQRVRRAIAPAVTEPEEGESKNDATAVHGKVTVPVPNAEKPTAIELTPVSSRLSDARNRMKEIDAISN